MVLPSAKPLDESERNPYDVCGSSVLDPAHELKGTTSCDTWVALFTTSKAGLVRARGSVRLQIEYTPKLGFAFTTEISTTAVDKPPELMAHLDITTIKAKHLTAMDSNGASDPYCILTLESPLIQQQSFRTSVKTVTVNPEWYYLHALN